MLQVNYLGESQVFSAEQIAAMMFTKLKEITEHALKIKVNDCVISVSFCLSKVKLDKFTFPHISIITGSD